MDVDGSHLKSSLTFSRLDAIRARRRYHNRSRSIGQSYAADYLASNDSRARVKRPAIGASCRIKDWRLIEELPYAAVNVRKVRFHPAG